MRRIIKAKELRGLDAVPGARWLLGKYLVRARPDGTGEARMITEVEAYDGEGDRACHARAGRTARTQTLYAAGGVWYVYLCYGIHEMLNVVVGREDWPAAVLIRGLDGISGPGRVTKHLMIDRTFNGAPAAVQSGLWLEDRGVEVAPQKVQATPRIGVDYAGPVWANKPWRFVIGAAGALREPARQTSRRPEAAKNC